MSCPDATPEWDEVADLERQAKIAAERVIDAKNERYIGSEKFWQDIDALVSMAGRPRAGSSVETLEQKIEWAKKKFTELQSAYTESLWKK